MSKLSRLREWLKTAGSCPCCGAGRLALDETMDAKLYGFEAEAFYECGARVQLHPGHASELQAADGCPMSLFQKLDQIEQDIFEEAEEEEGVL